MPGILYPVNSCKTSMEKTLSVTEAARQFADLVNGAYYNHETTVVLKLLITPPPAKIVPADVLPRLDHGLWGSDQGSSNCAMPWQNIKSSITLPT